MFNLIIAEDEKMLLDRLTGIVDYKNYGFNLVAKFSNGQDVIDYMERYHVDLIISDIRMPKATGLDVAKYVYERKLNTQVIIISGFNEFEYARTSIQYNVLDFLSKPFRKAEYIAALKKAYDKLTSKHSHYEINSFFKSVCYGAHINREFICEEIVRLNLDINIHDDICMYFTLDVLNPEVYLNKPSHDIDNMTNISNNILLFADLPIKYCSVINFTLSHIEYFLVFDSAKGNKNLLSDVKEQIVLFMSNLGLDVVINKQHLFENLMELISSRAISLNELLSVYTQSFVDYLISGEQNKIHSACDMVFQTILQLDTNDYSTVLNHLIAKINPVLQSYWNKHISLNIPLSSNADKDTVISVKNQIKETIATCYTKHSLLDSITSYIMANYAKQITLDDVAKNSFISKVYLCQYIKKCTNMTFNEYITHVRIEKAKELLSNTDLKIHQICENIGYKTTAHFAKVFKANTGLTPSDYKKNYSDLNLHK